MNTDIQDKCFVRNVKMILWQTSRDLYVFLNKQPTMANQRQAEVKGMLSTSLQPLSRTAALGGGADFNRLGIN